MSADTKSIFSTIIKLAVISLVVGLVIRGLNLEPMGVLEGIMAFLAGLAEWFGDLIAGFMTWGGKYILAGAVIVIPIWFVMKMIKIARNK